MMIHDPDFVLEEHTVLHVYKCLEDTYAGSTQTNTESCWCVVIQSDSVSSCAYVDWIIGDGGSVAVGGVDDFDIVPESQWPDEVCAAVAKHVLLKGARDECRPAKNRRRDQV